MFCSRDFHDIKDDSAYLSSTPKKSQGTIPYCDSLALDKQQLIVGWKLRNLIQIPPAVRPFFTPSVLEAKGF